MKQTIIILLTVFAHFVCLADSNRIAPNTKWTHSWSQGEDATSTFYYFFEDNGRVTRIRMMWNGGAQNKPSVTDYFLDESRAIRIVVQEASRENIAALIQGNSTGLKVISEIKILKLHSGKRLVPVPPRKTLNDSERNHLNNIIDLLREDRALYKK